jgi:hypothetical protein
MDEAILVQFKFSHTDNYYTNWVQSLKGFNINSRG